MPTDRGDMFNGSGYFDDTAGKAIDRADKDNERFHKLLETIFNICGCKDNT